MKKLKIGLIVSAVAVAAAAGFGLWVWKGGSTSNPHSYKTIGDIAAPRGYERVAGDGFARYLRSLPLKEKGSDVMLYTGEKAGFQSINYAVVDLPVISNSEQCADMCIRLRAEYLYNSGQTGKICFDNVNGKTMRFGGGGRKAFESYLRKVYGVASTYSLSRSMAAQELKDLKPGDVFVYAGVDRGTTLGHAMMVVDVVQNKDGKKKFMLAEGFTPARELHIVRTAQSLMTSPWFTLDEDAERLLLTAAYYKASELKTWE